MTDPVHTITAKYRVVTPMFLSGADQDKAEFRLASFKGALRFWWRAVAAQYYGNVQAMRCKEDNIFGSTRTGVSNVRMRLASCDVVHTISEGSVLRDENNVVGEGARYLGYGVMEAFASKKKATMAGQLTRSCLQGPFRFTVDFRCRDLNQHDLSLLQQAIKALGLLGGLGSKSRKGYGSLLLEELTLDGGESWVNPESSAALADDIRSLYAPATGKQLPPFTSLSDRSRHVILKKEDKSSLALLDRIGREMMRYRSWGHNGKVLGKESEKNFKDDHDLMKMEPNKRNTHPKRIVFGLPHNYGQGTKDQIPPPTNKKHGEENELTRRASPLMIHVHECDGNALAVLSFLPATFLPKGDSAKVNVGGQLVPVIPDPEIWQPVEILLDRFATRKESFGDTLEVRP